jgi:hypothetical protein
LSLCSEKLNSKFAFTFNLYRYTEAREELAAARAELAEVRTGRGGGDSVASSPAGGGGGGGDWWGDSSSQSVYDRPGSLTAEEAAAKEEERYQLVAELQQKSRWGCTS